MREGEPRHYFYRFADPLLEPYVILNGLASGLMTDDQLVELDRTTVVEPDASRESGTLF